MNEIITQEIVDIYWKNLFTKEGISWVAGPAMYKDSFDIPYTTLCNGIVKAEGYPSISWHSVPTFALARAFTAELLYWLESRDMVVWRTQPLLEHYEAFESEDNIINKEAVQDGLAQPERAVYKTERWQIYCRLTAYYRKHP